MSNPDYIIQVTVLSGDGTKKLLQWETGASAEDEYVAERIAQGVSEPIAVALAYVHTYDLMGGPPTLDRTNQAQPRYPDGTLPRYPKYLAEVFKAQALYPEWRIGQSYFNVLFDIDPVLADSLRGGPFDPFYKDERISEFCQKVLEAWA